ncbi:double-strand break repair helicase AddA [Lacibacterium aquatile]|uniref:DNA 3'-5' helicase n=1 Tax=Lacibacterium aquatile TaxID=1168082 RepID=A0ABW5DT75_9PROT
MTGHSQASALQRRATRPDRSVWVAASAGTGKTKVLTDRVLALLLAGSPPERLLCLTFTKAAAAEMQNRIMKRLGDWATLDDARLAATLEELTDTEPTPGLLITARRLFGRVLEAPGRLKIQTIHSFCQSLLGRFPLEARLPPGFTAMDEPTADGLLVEARNAILARARDIDPLLALDLALVAERAGEEGLLDLMRALTSEREQLARRLKHHGGSDALIEALARRLSVDPDMTPHRLREEFLARLLADEGTLRRTAEAFAKGTKTDIAKSDTLYGLLEARDAERLDGYLGIFLTAEGEIRKTLATKAVCEANPWLPPFLDTSAEAALRFRASEAALGTFQASAALIRLGLSVLAEYEALKRQRAWLDYDDLILKTLDLLRAGTSWVMFKLDGGLDHILIDEAQDTNPEQWEVVRLLAEEFFAGFGASEEVLRTLFVVGDAKQSIFSFQRADPVKFGEMRRFFANRIDEARQTFEQIDLLHSFRSTEAILKAVDLICNGPAADGVLDGGVAVQHLVSRIGQGGLVEVWPLTVKADPEEEEPWRLPTETAADVVPLRRVAQLIARTIRRWLDSGERLASQDRPVKAGDVLILVRRRGTFMAEMVRALKGADVPVAGADRMVLTEQLAVMDLLALARFLLLPQDDLSLACLLKSPLIGLSEDQLYAAAIDRVGDLWGSLQARKDSDPGLGAAVDRLKEWLRRADLQRPYEFYAQVLGLEGGRQALLARLGEEAADPIDEFLNQCLAFEQAHTPSLQGFLYWLDSSMQEIKREMEAGGRDEVRIMTVHGAKGLQAPIVFMPDTTDMGRLREVLFWPEAPEEPWGPLWVAGKSSADPVSLDVRELEKQSQDREYRRLLYVALTRAEDRLYVLGWQNTKELPAGCWYDLILQGLLTDATAFEPDFTSQGFPDWPGQGWRLTTAQSAPPKRSMAAEATQAAASLPDWVRRPPPVEPTPSRPLAPSKLDEDPPARSPLAGEMTGYKRGRLVHRLLQTLPDLAPERRADAARRFLSRPLHTLGEADVAALSQEVMAVLEDAAFAPIFAPGSRAEVPLAGVLGSLVIAGQVDRLAVTEREVLIVDFKTNRPPPRDPSLVGQSYIKQMAVYRGLLARLYPGLPVRCALLWTDGPFLMELPEDRLEAALREITG